MAVILQHFSTTAQTYSTGWIPSVVPHGYMAVDLFFVLSGFIMAYTYQGAFEADGLRAYIPFLQKRIARIAPLGLFMTVVFVTLGAVAPAVGRGDLFSNEYLMQQGSWTMISINVLHLQGFFPYHNINAPSWSVSLEIIAYVLFPLFLRLMNRVPWLVLGVGVAVLAGFAAQEPHLGLASRSVTLDLTRCLTEFTFGMGVFRLFLIRARHPWIGSDVGTWAITAGAAGLMLLRIDLLMALSFPFLILAWASNTGGAGRVMGSRIPYALGTISFSLYLVHHVFRGVDLALLQAFYPTPVSPLAALAFVVVASLAVIPVAALVYRVIERPGRVAFNAAFAWSNRTALPGLPTGA